MSHRQEELDLEASSPVPELSRDDGSDGDSDGMRPTGSDAFHSMVDLNFLTYASYVICERAIPALADGLKPVQRRILHSLHEKDDGRFIKVANIAGHCMQYHPHGDASIIDALINLTNKEYLIEGQGNFGNLMTGDRAAASRYIECRLTDLARAELFNKEITTYVPSYDGRNREPVALPAKIPLLLMLGAEGIAVGLSTRILPHNTAELLEAQIAILRKKKFSVFPDFQQGGLMDVSEYNCGAGRVRLRARIALGKDGRLVISEIPRGTTTESLIASIEDASRRKKVPVRAIDDFTADKVNIELKLSPGADRQKAIQALYAFTDCGIAVAGRPVVIHEDQPVEMTIDDILRENTRQLVDILDRELRLKKRQLEEEIHTKTLVRIFVENRIYKKIEKCKTYETVRKAVANGLKPFESQLSRAVTEQDIEMLLAIRIKRISMFDINRNRKEIDAILAELKKVSRELRDTTAYAVRYLRGLLKKYAQRYPRRTEITSFKAVEVKELTARELTLGYDRKKGYLGHQVAGEQLLECSSYDKVILVWRDGRYQVTTPPDRLFVDSDLVYCARADRDRVMTAVYTLDDITHIKRFKFGGTILNKRYYCCGDADSRVLLLADDNPETVFVRFKPAKRQRIHQQFFTPGDVPVKGVKARGPIMTTKKIDRLATKKPRWWSDNDKTPRGAVVDC